MKSDISSYSISTILNQLISNNSCQGYLIAFFSRKIIPAETWYNTYDGELLAFI